MFWKNKSESSPTKETILQTLRSIKPAGADKDIVSNGQVSEIFLKEGSAMFSISVPADEAEAMEPLRKAAEEAVKAMDGINKVMVVLTAEHAPSRDGQGAPRPAPQPKRPQQPRAPQGGQPKGNPPAKLEVKGVKKIIAVSSAKGGVGKSTTAVNLALALQANGLKVGILDADIYGPSIPRLLNIKERPRTIEGTRILQPLKAYGLVAMSIGLLVDEDAPMIWRGPMVVSALDADVARCCMGHGRRA